MKFISTSHSTPGGIPNKSFKAAGANVKTSRLNAGGDKNWRGKRGGAKMVSKSHSKKSMAY